MLRVSHASSLPSCPSTLLRSMIASAVDSGRLWTSRYPWEAPFPGDVDPSAASMDILKCRW